MNCTKCNDTGTARWGGFYNHRGPDVLCTCERGQFLALPEAERIAITAAHVAARQAAERAARAARRAIREAAQA